MLLPICMAMGYGLWSGAKKTKKKYCRFEYDFKHFAIWCLTGFGIGEKKQQQQPKTCQTWHFRDLPCDNNKWEMTATAKYNVFYNLKYEFYE